ncbi:MAG: hypothetical protein ACOCWG_02355 [bacterium]
MYVLCDTCSILMLIRIAPEMFIDPAFECTTIFDVYKEIFQTAKFKDKYPWRNQFKSIIKYIGQSKVNSKSVKETVALIGNLSNNQKNQRTGKYFDLSRVDRLIAACIYEFNYEISSVDRYLIDFIKQNFDKDAIKPLALINIWLDKALITWDEEKQSYLRDWKLQNEAAQDKEDIKKFEELTGIKYCGT